MRTNGPHRRFYPPTAVMRVCCALVLAAMLCVGGAAQATRIDEPLPDAAQEKTAHAVFRELRCVVCEGQSLAESDATLAVQMRAHVRTLIAQGKTEDEILTYFRERYGEHILLTPVMARHTALLWLAPVLLTAAGGYAVWRATRQQTDDRA
jgi:cytochrome c-type biogenesis protein CcmH